MPVEEHLESQNARHVQLAAAAIVIQDRRSGLKQRGHPDPDLPVGERTLNAEFSGHPHVRGKAPESERVSHQRGGDQKTADSQRYVAVFPVFPMDEAAPLNPDPHQHTLRPA